MTSAHAASVQAVALEDALIARVLDDVRARRAGVRALGAKTMIVVRDAALREHVYGILLGTQELGGALIGIEVSTLATVAAAILARAQAPAPAGRRRLALLAGRAALLRAELQPLIGALDEGPATLLPVLQRLTEAGLCAALSAPALERIADEDRPLGGAAERERLRALVEVLGDLEARGECGLEPAHLSAAEALSRDKDLLEADCVLLYRAERVGGQENALAAALLRRGAEWIGNEPSGSGARAALGFAAVGAPVAVAAEAAAAAPEPQKLHARALDPLAEAELAVQSLSAFSAETGVPVGPRLGVVAFGPERYATALRRAFERAGLPFSSRGLDGPLSPTGRELCGLANLLELGGRTPTSAWLEVQQLGPEAGPIGDLGLAAQALGLGRLQALAAVDLGKALGKAQHYALPVRLGTGVGPAGEGLAEEGTGDDDLSEEPYDRASGGTAEGMGGPAAAQASPAEKRRSVPRASLQLLIDLAARVLADVAPQTAEPAALLSPEALAERSLRLGGQHLGWIADSAPMRALDAATASLCSEFRGLELAWNEWSAELAQELRRRGTERLGARGDGVRVLSATVAHGHVFEALAVIGLDRSGLGSGGQPDPFLSDRAAEGLSEVLPDLLPARELGFERQAQAIEMTGAARQRLILLSAQHDAEDRPLIAAPLFERLTEGAAALELPPPLQWPYSHALGTAGAGHDDAFAALLQLGLDQERAGSAIPAAELAAARIDLLDVVDERPGRAAARGLGPFAGLVGPTAEVGDPRSDPLFVTTLESQARCGWQTFLRRVLRIEPLPDPLASLPQLDARLSGIVVHDALERLLGGPGLASDLDDALHVDPLRPDRPTGRELRRAVEHSAEQAAREAGWNLPGLRRLLTESTMPVVEHAVELIWSAAAPRVVGLELQGQVELEREDKSRRALHFRADRVDRDEHGALLLIDYKTGAPVSDAKGEATRKRHLLKKIREGARLQGAAYAMDRGPGSRGAYLSLKVRGKPIPDAYRFEAVSADDDELMEAFRGAAGIALEAYEAGAFAPRLLQDDLRDKGPWCDRCEVAEACVRGDSGALARHAAWIENARETEPEVPLMRAWLRLNDIAQETRS